MEKIWFCKLGGEVGTEGLPSGADHPMREAVSATFQKLTGNAPAFIFSGWDGHLTEPERAVHENREPSAVFEDAWHTVAPGLDRAIQRGRLAEVVLHFGDLRRMGFGTAVAIAEALRHWDC